MKLSGRSLCVVILLTTSIGLLYLGSGICDSDSFGPEVIKRYDDLGELWIHWIKVCGAAGICAEGQRLGSSGHDSSSHAVCMRHDADQIAFFIYATFSYRNNDIPGRVN